MDYADLLYQAAKAGDIAKVDEIVTNHGVNVRNYGQSKVVTPQISSNLLERPSTQYEPIFIENEKCPTTQHVDGGSGMAAIQIAATNGDLDAIKLLLEKGADVRLHSKNQFKKDTALYIAAEQGHWKIVQFLLDQANEAYLRVPGEIYEFLLQYSSKITINKKLQEKVSTLSKIKTGYLKNRQK